MWFVSRELFHPIGGTKLIFMTETIFDLVIIGAGPAGLSAAEAAAREGLNYLVIEKGTIADTIRQYPVGPHAVLDAE